MVDAYRYMIKYQSDDTFDNMYIDSNLTSHEGEQLVPMRRWELAEKYQVASSFSYFFVNNKCLVCEAKSREGLNPLMRLHNILYVKYSTISISQFRPHDVCVSAPTGSGKTLAFVLPIVQALRNRVVPRVRALVVLPVQDLPVLFEPVQPR